MAQWNAPDQQYYPYPVYQQPGVYQPTPQPFRTPPLPKQTLFDPNLPGPSCIQRNEHLIPKGETPRELRNRAEKQRRDKLNKSIAELASLVPPVVAASRKIDKTGVLRLTAHYLRAHQYVFGDAMNRPPPPELSNQTAETLLRLLNGFLLTTTYKGLVVVVSRNVQQYLGYNELDLLGHNIFNIIHEDDQQLMREQLMPKKELLGPNGELLVPEDPEEQLKMERSLANEKRNFTIRFKKQSLRSEPDVYLRCHVQGSLRKSDRACRRYSRCCQIVRRARARGDNPCSSGNDVVFIGVVRPTIETFLTEMEMESFNMEYRTRHSVDGQIIQCEQRISLITGYMAQEVNGVNAMNFMHRDDVRWVIIALREMYDEHRVFGESCYRLMMKNGQFIYLKTRGCLEVDKETRVVTSFVCTNTVVGEEEGRHLNKLMKKKFAMLVNNNKDLPLEEDEFKDASDQFPVEDPRNLEKVILHLVTNLPSPKPLEPGLSSDNCKPHLAIIPPQRERILSAIKKIYSVINSLKMEKKPRVVSEEIPDELQYGEEGYRSPTPVSKRVLGETTLSLPPRPHSVSPTPRDASPFGTPRRRGLGHFVPMSSRTSSQEFINLRRQIEGPVFGLLSADSSPWVSAEISQEATSSSLELEAQRLRRCEAIYEADGEAAHSSAAPMTGAKRPSTSFEDEGKHKVPKPGECISSTFEKFIINSLEEDQLPILTKDALESFPEMMENADIDVEDLLKSMEQQQG